MNMIAKLKIVPLLAALLTGFTLAPTLAVAANDNERNPHAQQRANHQQAQTRGHRNGQHKKHKRDQHRQHPVNHHGANRSHRGHGHHSARVVCRDRNHYRNHHYAHHGHRHTVVRNSYRQPVYLADYPRLMLGLHGDNYDIIFRDR